MLTKACRQMFVCYKQMLFGISLFMEQRYKFFLFPRKILEQWRPLLIQCLLCFIFCTSGFLLCSSKHMLRGLFPYYNSTVGNSVWFTKHYNSSKAQTLKNSNWRWAGKRETHILRYIYISIYLSIYIYIHIYIWFCFQHEFRHKNVAVQLPCIYIKHLANFDNYRFYFAW